MNWRRTVEKLAARDGWLCHYCERELVMTPKIPAGEPIPASVVFDPAKPTIDHVVPQSKGGRDGLYNLVLACRSCNSSKRDTLYVDFSEAAA